MQDVSSVCVLSHTFLVQFDKLSLIEAQMDEDIRDGAELFKKKFSKI